MRLHSGIVEDGCWRARQALSPVIRQEVEAEFAERLLSADEAEKRRLRSEIERVIRQRLDKKAPRWALY
ncbi:MAG: hypothetical protein SFV23_06565 [Planctomycetaceae bacterium]|nr:hypothetical protein [Planctomycetaceae bacterium]